jgi:hypothetical protein
MRASWIVFGGVWLGWAASIVGCATEGDSNPPVGATMETGGEGAQGTVLWTGGANGLSSGGRLGTSGAPATGGATGIGGSIAVGGSIATGGGGSTCLVGAPCVGTGTCTGPNGTCTCNTLGRYSNCVGGATGGTGSGGRSTTGGSRATGGFGTSTCVRSGVCTPNNSTCTTLGGGTCRCNNGVWGGSGCN